MIIIVYIVQHFKLLRIYFSFTKHAFPLALRSDLKSARVEINEIVNENDALRMEVAKARYSTPSGLTAEEEESMSDAERNEINTLMVENEELKKEVGG